MLQGDLERCAVVTAGGLVEQWQEELQEKFGLQFGLLTRQLAEDHFDQSVTESPRPQVRSGRLRGQMT